MTAYTVRVRARRRGALSAFFWLTYVVEAGDMEEALYVARKRAHDAGEEAASALALNPDHAGSALVSPLEGCDR